MILTIGNPVYDELILPGQPLNGRVLSGCSTNAALALARLGLPAMVWGSIGLDRRDACLQDLKVRGVGAALSTGACTGGFRLTYPADGSERTLDVLGRADPLGVPPPDLVSDSEAVVVGPILGEVSTAIVRAVKAAATGPLFLDPQGMLRDVTEARVVGRIQPGLTELLHLFAVVKPNEHEATLLTGVDATAFPADAARRLHDMGAPIAIVTLAERGSVVFDGRRMAWIPAFAVNAVDPTGAGNTYMAGFVAEYLRSGDPFQAGLHGSAVASIMVQHMGPDFPLTPAEARRRCDTLTPRFLSP